MEKKKIQIKNETGKWKKKKKKKGEAEKWEKYSDELESQNYMKRTRKIIWILKRKLIENRIEKRRKEKKKEGAQIETEH